MWGAGAGGGVGPGWNNDQWSLNPVHYANLPHEQVDWAALAQRWIQMKTENQEVSTPPQQPPPPSTHQNQYHSQQQPVPPLQPHQQPLPPQQHHHSHSQQPRMLAHQHQHSQSHHHAPPHQSQQPPQFQWQPDMNPDYSSERLLQHPPPLATDNRQNYSSHNSFPPVVPDVRSPLLPTQPHNFNQHGFKKGSQLSQQWSARAPPPALRDKYYTTHATLNSDGMDYSDDHLAELEAARRRSLPAWIREGLEKVEREKRKQEEKERAALERETTRQLELEDSSRPSKWAVDVQEEESDEEPEPPNLPEVDIKGTTQRIVKPNYEPDLHLILSSMSEDDRLELIMDTVRRQLTRVLLEVTNEEIENVAQECLSRKQKVISATQVRKTGALASLTTGPLGLGTYGSDSDSAGSDEERDNSDNSDYNSEAELIAEMERKKRLFKLRELELMQRSPAKSRGSSRTRSRTRSVSRSGSETESKEASSTLTDQRAEKVEKTILSAGNSGTPEPDEIDESSLSPNLNSSVSLTSSAKGNGAVKSKSHAKRSRKSHSNSKERSRDRSSSRDRRRRKSRSRSKSNGRKNHRSSRRAKSKSRSVSRHRRMSRSQSRDVSRDRSPSIGARRRKSRSNSKTKSRKIHRSSRRGRSKSRSVSKHRKSRSKSTERSRDRSTSRDKSRRKSRSGSKSNGRKSRRSSRRVRSKSRSSSRHRRKSRSHSKERRKRHNKYSRSKSPRRRRSRSRS